MEILSLSDLRKALKPIGFTVRTKSYSEFTAGYYVHVASGTAITFNCASEQQLEMLRPLLEFWKVHRNALDDFYKKTNISGLRPQVIHIFTNKGQVS